MQIHSLTKILLSILLFLCLLKMPYGYYQLVRFIAVVFFLICAYYSYTSEIKLEMFIYIGLALLFQPFAKIALGKQIWNIIDVLVGIYLIYSVINDKQKTKQ